jgi:hypothetical protein
MSSVYYSHCTSKCTGARSRKTTSCCRMADVDDEEAELYGASAPSDVKLADSSIGHNESALDLDGMGEKDDDDEANDNPEDDDGSDKFVHDQYLPFGSDHEAIYYRVDVIIDQEELHTSPQSQWSKMVRIFQI